MLEKLLKKFWQKSTFFKFLFAVFNAYLYFSEDFMKLLEAHLYDISDMFSHESTPILSVP